MKQKSITVELQNSVLLLQVLLFPVFLPSNTTISPSKTTTLPSNTATATALTTIANVSNATTHAPLPTMAFQLTQHSLFQVQMLMWLLHHVHNWCCKFHRSNCPCSESSGCCSLPVQILQVKRSSLPHTLGLAHVHTSLLVSKCHTLGHHLQYNVWEHFVALF